MVPWTHLREAFLRWMWTDLTSEFTHFNLVIRLTIGKQLAIPFSTVLRPLGPCEPLEPAAILEWSHTKQPETFLCCCPSFSHYYMTSDTEGNRHVLFLQVWFSLASGEVKHMVPLIHLNLNSCLLPMWFDRQRSCLREQRAIFRFWTESHYFVVVSLLFIN